MKLDNIGGLMWKTFAGSAKVDIVCQYNCRYKFQTTTDKTTSKQLEPTKKCTLPDPKMFSSSTTTYCAQNLGIVTHVDAKNMCKSFNAYLPQPKNVAENKFLVDYFNKNQLAKQDFWLDMTKSSGNVRKKRSITKSLDSIFFIV